MEFKHNDKVKQINPCPWISGQPYNPSRRTWSRERGEHTEWVAGYSEPTARNTTFLFKGQWKHKPNLCWCQGIATGRTYIFKIDSIVLV